MSGLFADAQECLFGETEFLDAADYKKRLRQAFQGPFEYPLVLLVYNKEVTCNVLAAAGVDMSEWRKDGLLELLCQSQWNRPEEDLEPKEERKPGFDAERTQEYRTKQEHDQRQDFRYQGRYVDDRNPTLKRYRSPSPHRRHIKQSYPPASYQGSSRDYNSSTTRFSGMSTRRDNGIHVVDVRELYEVLSHRQNARAAVDCTGPALELGVSLAKSGWCAGNKCL